jgi:hypothetical protein
MAKNTQIKLQNGETITLTERELLFCQNYLGDANRNATQAAIRAGYSDKTAKIQASKMLTKVDLKKYIHDQTAPVLDRLGVTRERVLQELSELAMSRPGLVVSKDNPIPLGYQDSHTFKTFNINGVEVDSHEKSVTFNYAPKMKALATVAEYLGIIERKQPEAPQVPQQVNLFQQINNYMQEK